MYPEAGATFNLVNAFICLVPASLSALAGGYLSDKLQKQSPMIKPQIVMLSNLLSVPFAYLAFTCTDNFWFSTYMIMAHWLLSEAWYAPNMTMLQNTTSSQNLGSVISIYCLLTTLTGVVGTSFLGQIQLEFDAVNNPEFYGASLTAMVLASQLGCIPFFWKAGKAYEKKLALKNEDSRIMEPGEWRDS